MRPVTTRRPLNELAKALKLLTALLSPDADLAQIVGDLGEPVVHFLAELADLPRLLGKPLLPPDRGDGAGDGDQVGRGGEQHALFERKVPQGRIMLERGREEMLAGDEHDDIIGRVVELAPIGLVAERC